MTAPDDAARRSPRAKSAERIGARAQSDAALFASDGGTAGTTTDGGGLHRLLVESVTDYAIFALDPKGLVLSWNTGAQNIKGYTADEIIGQHFSVFYPAEDVAARKPQWELDVAVDEGRLEDEGWRVRKDGTRFWANVVITTLRNDAGDLVGFAKVTRDLTERRAAEEALRKSEERFRLIVHSVRDYGIFMLDPTGHIASWNEGARQLKGYTADEIIGQHFSKFYPAEAIAAAKPDRELEIATRDGRFEDEGWRVKKDGSQFWANVIITALRNDRGTLIGFAKVTRDLTERKAAEERAIADARRIATVEVANQTKSGFLAAMSHELRTPLNAIGGYAELIEIGVGGSVNDRQREYLTRIRTSQQHLLGIITDLLNYSRIEAGQMNYEMMPVPVNAMLATVIPLLHPQAMAKGIALEHARGDATLAGWVDRTKAEQIVLNLLSNAVKFTPAGGVVTVECKDADDSIAIIVRDTGPGIPDDKQAAIFEPFVQLGRNLTSPHEGTGLGLAISRDLARAMGGDVTVASVFGTGSAFTFTMPRVSPVPTEST